jgi:hypothetical protein
VKRLLGIVVALALIVGALSSHSKSSTPTTAASSAPAATTSSSEPTPVELAGTYTRCDQNISAGPHTTCRFADNVFRAFARDVSGESSDEASDDSVRATSPATRRTYSMVCRTSAGTTTCSGARSARVRFPLWAAQVYYKAPPKSESSRTYEAPPSPEPAEEEPTEPESGEAEPNEAEAECTNGTYVNSAGNTVCSPEESPTQPAGATARCEDGTYSFSESRSGTCSHHGGVSEWLH